jgi:tripartite-type tricarboxylate transporter receptor subunit TctC
MNMTKKLMKKLLISIGLTFFISANLIAQDLPRKPLRLVVPLASGGGTDIVARILANGLTSHWDRQVLVDNRPGAAGSIGAGIVARATPDGNTLLVASSTLAISAAMMPEIGKEVIPNLSAITLVASQPSVILVNNDIPTKTLDDLISLLKSQPGKLNFGSAGVGTASHLANELFLIKTQTNALHVPYKSVGIAASGFLKNEIQFMVTNLATAQSLISNNRVRALAVTSNNRISILPDVPTVRETGVKDYEYSTWYGVLSPAKTPKKIVNKISSDIRFVLENSQIKNHLQQQGLTVLGTTPENFTKNLNSEINRWNMVVQKMDLK